MVTAFESGRRFTWETRRPGLHMMATHEEIFPDGTGANNVLVTEAKGLLALLLAPILRGTIRPALSTENDGLRNRYEEIAQKRGGANTAGMEGRPLQRCPYKPRPRR